MRIRAQADSPAPPIPDPAPQPLPDRRYNEELDVKDVTWINATGARCGTRNGDDLNVLFRHDARRAGAASGIRRRGAGRRSCSILNAYHDVVRVTLPGCPGGQSWMRLIDTNLEVDHGGSFASAMNTMRPDAH